MCGMFHRLRCAAASGCKAKGDAPMPCFSPLTAWQSPKPRPNGKANILFGDNPPFGSTRLQLPCGQCIGCRLERSRQWAVRCMHEAQLHDSNCFITLTYDNDNCPADGGLRKSDFQKFMKRLRKRFPEQDIRYFMCGEYGEESYRPHFHAALFNFEFVDKVLYQRKGGNDLYVSGVLSELWPFGLAVIGALTFESAAYIARYCTKKITGEAAERHYERFDSLTGEIFKVLPEYANMSLRPAIGRRWYEKYGADVFPYDEVVLAGRAGKPPRYYDNLLERFDHELHQSIKDARKSNAELREADNSPRRLRDRRRVKEAQVTSLKRAIQ